MKRPKEELFIEEQAELWSSQMGINDGILKLMKSYEELWSIQEKLNLSYLIGYFLIVVWLIFLTVKIIW